MNENINMFLEQEIKIRKKKCNWCHEIKPITEFAKNKKEFLTYCKKCANEYRNSYRKKLKKINKNKNPYNNTFKRCSKCKKFKKRSKDNWAEVKRTKDGLGYWCRKCNKENNIKRRYNLTIEEYNQILERQDKKCAICGIHQSKLKRGLFVDHDHKTKKVRGLLCSVCNLRVEIIENETYPKILKYLDENK